MNTRKAAMRVISICLRVAVFAVIVLGIICLGQTAYHYTHEVFSDEAIDKAPGKNVLIKIPENVSGKQLAKVLEQNGLIEDAIVFRIKMKIGDYGDTIKAGNYELNTSMTPSEMFKVLFSQNGDDET